MNAIDILGSLLGGGRSRSSGGKGGGVGADILSEILGGSRAPAPQSNAGGARGNAPMSPEQLEEMLGVGRSSGSSQPTSQPQSRTQANQPQPRTAPQQQNPQLPTDIFGQRQRQAPKINLSVPKPTPLSDNDQAVLLIRAMINSAKVDGEISEDEQNNILGQVGDTSPETIQFLRTEFARPLNVNEYALSLPVGMEEKAYGISLMAIKLDTKEEADYMRQLAKALRIAPELCNQLHQQQNAPLLYS